MSSSFSWQTLSIIRSQDLSILSQAIEPLNNPAIPSTHACFNVGLSTESVTQITPICATQSVDSHPALLSVRILSTVSLESSSRTHSHSLPVKISLSLNCQYTTHRPLHYQLSRLSLNHDNGSYFHLV